MLVSLSRNIPDENNSDSEGGEEQNATHATTVTQGSSDNHSDEHVVSDNHSDEHVVSDNHSDEHVFSDNHSDEHEVSDSHASDESLANQGERKNVLSEENGGSDVYFEETGSDVHLDEQAGSHVYFVSQSESNIAEQTGSDVHFEGQAGSNVDPEDRTGSDVHVEVKKTTTSDVRGGRIIFDEDTDVISGGEAEQSPLKERYESVATVGPLTGLGRTGGGHGHILHQGHSLQPTFLPLLD